jgi:hypothetical protein
MAEREGFEPSLEFPLNTLSKRAPSATRPPLHLESRKTLRFALHLETRKTLSLCAPDLNTPDFATASLCAPDLLRSPGRVRHQSSRRGWLGEMGIKALTPKMLPTVNGTENPAPGGTTPGYPPEAAHRTPQSAAANLPWEPSPPAPDPAARSENED